MKICIVIGTRPEIIQSAVVARELRKRGHEVITIHTKQHYQEEMSGVFFRNMDIPKPDYGLATGSGTHGQQTGWMLARIEHVLFENRPDWVLVFGDTNSTLAGALAAAKLNIPVAHVEAGMRSFNRTMPEEINRILVDHCSDLLFCSTLTAMENLIDEGIGLQSHLVGDVMYDAACYFNPLAQKRTIIRDLGLESNRYLLATIHRPYNVDVYKNLRNILMAFFELDETVVFPVHPRTKLKMSSFGLLDLWGAPNKVKAIDPVGYLDMLALEQNARMILTDSGGMQKEAYFFEVPCVTLRPETEWVETVETGWNKLAGAAKETIIEAAHNPSRRIDTRHPPIFGDGHASQKIAEILEKQA